MLCIVLKDHGCIMQRKPARANDKESCGRKLCVTSADTVPFKGSTVPVKEIALSILLMITTTTFVNGIEL